MPILRITLRCPDGLCQQVVAISAFRNHSGVPRIICNPRDWRAFSMKGGSQVALPDGFCWLDRVWFVGEDGSGHRTLDFDEYGQIVYPRNGDGINFLLWGMRLTIGTALASCRVQLLC